MLFLLIIIGILAYFLYKQVHNDKGGNGNRSVSSNSNIHSKNASVTGSIGSVFGTTESTNPSVTGTIGSVAYSKNSTLPESCLLGPGANETKKEDVSHYENRTSSGCGFYKAKSSQLKTPTEHAVSTNGLPSPVAKKDKFKAPKDVQKKAHSHDKQYDTLAMAPPDSVVFKRKDSKKTNKI